MDTRDAVDEAHEEAQAILAAIRKQKWPQPAEAIHHLATSPNPLADTVLFHLLDFRSPQVREAALKSLAERSEVLGRIAARALLEDANHLVRNAAAEVLGQVGTQQDVRRLRHALLDDHWVTRSTAADSLGAVGGKAAHPALKNAMTTDPHPVVRRDAAFALSYANQSAVVPDLEQALAGEREEQAQIGIFGALYALGEQRYLTGLLELLRSEDSSVRHAVVNSLGEIVRPADKEQAIQAIRDMLVHEDNPGVRSDAESTVEEIRSRSFSE